MSTTTDEPERPRGVEERLAALETELLDTKQLLVVGHRDTSDRLTFLRKRAGWILFWACIAGLGSCSYSENRTGSLESKVSSLSQQVSHLTTDAASQADLLQQCRLLGQAAARQGIVPTPVPDQTSSACYDQAKAGYDEVIAKARPKK